MRIGLLTQWFPPEPGPAALPGDLARGLAARGHEVEVLTGFPNYPTGELADGYRLRPRAIEHEPGVRVTRVALYPAHDASSLRRMTNYGSYALSAATIGLASTMQRIDALWVNYSPVTLALPMVIQRWTRHTPTVVHVLDLWPDTLAAAGFASTGGAMGRASIRVAGAMATAMYRRAERVAFISPGVEDVLASRGVERDKLAYAPMWADESVAAPDPGLAPSVAIPDGHVCVTYAGTMGRAQDLDTFVRACATVRDLPVTCLMAGSGTEEDRLRSLARQVGADNVRFLGRLDRQEMSALMANSDLAYVGLNEHALASITMPSKLQAIMASGVAILGSVTGDAAEVITKSDAGWVTVPGDIDGLATTLRTAVTSGHEAMSQRGERARQYYYREFSMARGVDRVEQLLNEARAVARV